MRKSVHGRAIRYPAGQIGIWTHIVSPFTRLFFYNDQTTAADSGRLNNAGALVILKNFPAGQFGKWTHIAGLDFS
jgi:hypothetical protein